MKHTNKLKLLAIGAVLFFAGSIFADDPPAPIPYMELMVANSAVTTITYSLSKTYFDNHCHDTIGVTNMCSMRVEYDDVVATFKSTRSNSTCQVEFYLDKAPRVVNTGNFACRSYLKDGVVYAIVSGY